MSHLGFHKEKNMLPKIFLFVISTVADTEDKTGEALKFKNQSLYNVSTRGTPFR